METLELERNGRVAWVRLDRPKRLNALDETALTEIRETFDSLSGDKSVRAVVLAANGPVFSAGFDVRWMADLDAETVRDGLSTARAVYDAVESCAKPVIAAIQGPAIGGGLLLALTADFRLASETASFGAPEVMIGIFPSLDLIPRLERVVGLNASKRMVLTGETISATDAERIGLVESVTESDALLGEADALARRLAALPPDGVQAAKEAFAAAHRPGYEPWETEAFARCWSSPDREAAMRAFLKAR